MKQGMSLSQLAATIESNNATKKDYLVDTAKIAAVIDTISTGDVVLAIQNGVMQHYPMTQLAHRQVAERLQIPAKYYDRMRNEAPELLRDNINEWLHKEPETRMVRTLNGQVRAFLSNSYQRIDNFEVANTVLPVLATIPGIKSVSQDVTESRLYIKAVSKDIRAEIKTKRAPVGEIVEAGVMITNSEVGLGAVSVKPYAMFLFCSNGAVIDKGMRAAHIGSKMALSMDVSQLLSDETKKADDNVILMKVRDVVKASFDAAVFQRWIEKVAESTERKVVGDPSKAVVELANVYGLNEGEQSSVMRHLIEGGDLSAFGLMNAVTRTAEDCASYDRATELEAFGPSIIDLSASEWSRVAQAA